MKDGKLCICTPPLDDYVRSIYVFGPCLAFGLSMDDEETIEWFLQERLVAKGCRWRVVNCGGVSTGGGAMDEISVLNRMMGMGMRQGMALCEKAYRLEPKNWVVASVYANLLKESNHQMELAVLLDGDMKMFSDMDWYKKCRA